MSNLPGTSNFHRHEFERAGLKKTNKKCWFFSCCGEKLSKYRRIYQCKICGFEEVDYTVKVCEVCNGIK